MVPAYVGIACELVSRKEIYFTLLVKIFLVLDLDPYCPQTKHHKSAKHRVHIASSILTDILFLSFGRFKRDSCRSPNSGFGVRSCLTFSYIILLQKVINDFGWS